MEQAGVKFAHVAEGDGGPTQWALAADGHRYAVEKRHRAGEQPNTIGEAAAAIVDLFPAVA
jgi:hypothetical protein